MVIGLGNPGRAYDKTRHNVGFKVADIIAARMGVKFKRKWGVPYYFCQSISNEVQTILVKPRTFMNNSGSAAFSAMQRYGVSMERITIITDDVWLPLGSIRIRKKGGSGGHKGLASIIEAFATENISRCRIGIGGADESNLSEHVLDRFSDEEETILYNILSDAADAVIEIIDHGIEEAMTKYNTTGNYPNNSEKEPENFA